MTVNSGRSEMQNVIRSCGYIPYETKEGAKKDYCYNKTSQDYHTEVCTCQGDECNGSNTINISMISVILTILLAIVFK